MSTKTNPSAPGDQAQQQKTSSSGPRFSSDEILAEMAAEDKKAPPAPDKQDEEPAKKAEPEEENEDKDDDEDEKPAPPAKKAEPKEDDEDELDPKTRKNLLAIQRQERRSKEQLARERSAFEAEKKEWAPQVEEAKKVLSLKGKGMSRIDEAIEFLGLRADDLDPFARAVYARSPEAAKKNPAGRVAADRIAREREEKASTTDEIKQMREEIRALREEKQQQAQMAEAQKEAERYLDGAAKVISTGTFRDPETREVTRIEAPLAKLYLEKSPSKARVRMAQIALELEEKIGDTPDFVEVIEELEKRRREDLEDAGHDDAAIAAMISGSKKPKDDEEKKEAPKGRSLPKSGAGSRTSNKDASWDELKDEVKARDTKNA